MMIKSNKLAYIIKTNRQITYNFNYFLHKSEKIRCRILVNPNPLKHLNIQTLLM